mgnify:FL=1
MYHQYEFKQNCEHKKIERAFEEPDKDYLVVADALGENRSSSGGNTPYTREQSA